MLLAILVDIDDSQFFVFEHHSKDSFVVWIDKQFRLKHIRTSLYDSLLALFIHFVFDLFEEGRKKVVSQHLSNDLSPEKIPYLSLFVDADFVVILNHFLINNVTLKVSLLKAWLFPFKSKLNGNKLIFFSLLGQNPDLSVHCSDRFIFDSFDWKILWIKVYVLLPLFCRICRYYQMTVIFLF